MMKYDYYQPESVKEAMGLMEKMKGKAGYIAGGTDVIVRIKQGDYRPEALISLRGIESLAGIELNGGLTLGSMTRFSSILKHAGVLRDYPVLAVASGRLANPQVRNVATVGGNICNSAPSADSVPPLLVMEADILIQGPGGERRMPLEEFFTGPGQNRLEPGEILGEIHLPPLPERSGAAFLKHGRVSQDLAVANSAALVVMEKKVCKKCRLAAGAVAPVPLRLRNIEKMVEGEEIQPELLEQVARETSREVSPITDVRSTEEYRRELTGVLVKRAVQKAAEIADSRG